MLTNTTADDSGSAAAGVGADGVDASNVVPRLATATVAARCWRGLATHPCSTAHLTKEWPSWGSLSRHRVIRPLASSAISALGGGPSPAAVVRSWEGGCWRQLTDTATLAAVADAGVVPPRRATVDTACDVWSLSTERSGLLALARCHTCTNRHTHTHTHHE